MISFGELPADVLRKIALEFPIEKLVNYCQISRRFRTVCQDPSLWEARIHQDFPDVPTDMIREVRPEKRRDFYFMLFRERLENANETIEESHFEIFRPLREKQDRLEREIEELKERLRAA